MLRRRAAAVGDQSALRRIKVDKAKPALRFVASDGAEQAGRAGRARAASLREVIPPAESRSASRRRWLADMQTPNSDLAVVAHWLIRRAASPRA